MTTSSWYRRSVWQYKGNKEYTKQGYETAKLRFENSDLEVDCSERHYIITGANSGIGLATAIEIARRGGVIHLVCRNAKSMKEARSEIITTTGNDKIYQHQVNLAKPREAVKWAEEFLESGAPLDVLIHNAGGMTHQRELDEEGIETNFATNVLSIHLITTTLISLLNKSKDARVIMVSSAGMLTVKLDPHDLTFEKMNPFNGRLVYSQTKRQQVVMAFCYAQIYPNINFFSMHPGWVDTPALRNSLPAFYEQMKDNLRTPLQGADTIIWLAISNAALKHTSGLFFQDRVPVSTHLPLAWTRSTAADEQEFMRKLGEFYKQMSNLKLAPTPDEVQTVLTGAEQVPPQSQSEGVPKTEAQIRVNEVDTQNLNPKSQEGSFEKYPKGNEIESKGETAHLEVTEALSKQKEETQPTNEDPKSGSPSIDEKQETTSVSHQQDERSESPETLEPSPSSNGEDVQQKEAKLEPKQKEEIQKPEMVDRTSENSDSQPKNGTAADNEAKQDIATDSKQQEENPGHEIDLKGHPLSKAIDVDEAEGVEIEKEKAGTPDSETSSQISSDLNFTSPEKPAQELTNESEQPNLIDSGNKEKSGSFSESIEETAKQFQDVNLE